MVVAFRLVTAGDLLPAAEHFLGGHKHKLMRRP
jgi:hypothetical protein